MVIYYQSTIALSTTLVAVKTLNLALPLFITPYTFSRVKFASLRIQTTFLEPILEMLQLCQKVSLN